MKPVWKRFDFEGFYCLILKRIILGHQSIWIGRKTDNVQR